MKTKLLAITALLSLPSFTHASESSPPPRDTLDHPLGYQQKSQESDIISEKTFQARENTGNNKLNTAPLEDARKSIDKLDKDLKDLLLEDAKESIDKLDKALKELLHSKIKQISKPSQSPEDVLGLPTLIQEIQHEVGTISEKLILAGEKMEEKSAFYSNVKEKVDTIESKKLREEAFKKIEQLEKIAAKLVLNDAQTLSNNLWQFPRGVIVQKQSIFEPMTLFPQFTSLGVSTLILNSLRDKNHQNYDRYTIEEKVGMAQNILKFSASMASYAAKHFMQPLYMSQGFLFEEAHRVNHLAQHLIATKFADK